MLYSIFLGCYSPDANVIYIKNSVYQFYQYSTKEPDFYQSVDSHNFHAIMYIDIIAKSFLKLPIHVQAKFRFTLFLNVLSLNKSLFFCIVSRITMTNWMWYQILICFLYYFKCIADKCHINSRTFWISWYELLIWIKKYGEKIKENFN